MPVAVRESIQLRDPRFNQPMNLVCIERVQQSEGATGRPVSKIMRRKVKCEKTCHGIVSRDVKDETNDPMLDFGNIGFQESKSKYAR